MIRRPPRSTRTDTLFPYTTLFRSRSKLILATADLDTAEQCARYIGNREVRQMDEAYSYGYNNTRDASTLTPRKQVEPLVLPDDITNLPALHGYVKYPDGFPAGRIKLEWKRYPVVAEGFMPRANVQRSEEHTSELQSLMRISYAVFC